MPTMVNAREHKPRMGWNRENMQSKIPELTFDDGVEGVNLFLIP